MQYDIISKLCQFVLAMPTLEANIHACKLIKPLFQCSEECRVDNEFLFFCDALAYLLPKLHERECGWGVVELDCVMEHLQERQAADITYKNMAAWTYSPYGSLQDTQKIAYIGEVLDNGV